MNNISVVALFCSDVRQEKGGTETIVGVFPDTVNVPTIPGAFAQMHIYVRMHMLPSFKPRQIITRIVQPDGSEFDRSEMDQVLVERTREKAIEKDSPYMGLIAKFTMVPMHIAHEGRLQVIVSVDDEDHVAGALNLRRVAKAAT